MNPHITTPRRRNGLGLTIVLAATAGFLAACGGGSTTTPAPAPVDSVIVSGAPAATDVPAAGGAAVLPVDSNPITNTATATGLVIDSVLVENNVDAATGKDASDHLEIALSNTGSTELAGFEIFYTFTDQKTGVTENYYAKLPADFTIAGGSQRVVHFDDSGAPDHFAMNKFSLYSTSLSALDVSVTVSAEGVAVQTSTTKKDEGGAETAD
jgi:hypothetical protein